MEHVVRDALERVLGHPVDARADTPLSALGFEAIAWPALAAVLADVACLDDADAQGVETFGDLVRVVAIRGSAS